MERGEGQERMEGERGNRWRKKREGKELLLLHPFNSPLLQDNLGKPVPER